MIGFIGMLLARGGGSACVPKVFSREAALESARTDVRCIMDHGACCCDEIRYGSGRRERPPGRNMAEDAQTAYAGPPDTV
ncbi:hypothetical protein PBS_02580 [Paraburkholderia sp. 2C]